MHAFAEAILNGWWQGIVLTLLVWLVLRDMPRLSAATRLAIWHVTLAVVLLLPLLQRIPLPEWRRFAAPVASPAPELEERPAAPVARAPRPLVEVPPDEPFDVLLGFVLLLTGIQILRLAIGYLAVRRLKRKSRPAGIAMPVPLPRPVNVLVSDRIGMPMAVGYREPAILLPRALAESLTPEQLRYVLMHESAHLLRRDDWIALAERIVRAVFFFQPAVHFIGRQLEREREAACDDWVTAQAGETKPYAESLARVAELGSSGRAPILATGAGRPKEIFRRLEALLDRTRNRMPAVSEPMVIGAGLVLLLAVAQGAHFNHVFGLGSGYNSRWVESNGSFRREFKMRGEIRFTEDDLDVESMSPGAKLVVHQADGFRARTVEFEGGEDGTIARRYFSNGIARPFDGEARRFVEKMLPEWLREHGQDIPERLARMLRGKGPDSALDRIRTLRNAGAKRAYLEELFVQSTLDPAQLSRVLRIAGEIPSDGDKRHFLDATHDRYFNRGIDAQVLSFIDTLNSDGDRSHLLRQALERGDFAEASMPKLLRVLSRLNSDGDKTGVLVRFVEGRRHLPGEFFDVVATVHSDGDRRRCLEAAIEASGEDPETVRRVALNAQTINSDGDKSHVLRRVAGTFSEREEVRRAFFSAANSIHSDGDHRRVLMAVLERPKLEAETLREVSRSAAQINSDGDRAAVLKALTGRESAQ